jgi:hypothetical protein
MQVEIFESCVRSTGDLAGVFEHDGTTGYFYLCEMGENQKILGHLRVLVDEPNFLQTDVAVTWDVEEQLVGLFIRDELWAVFDAKARVPYGGDYKAGTSAMLPREMTARFVAR